MSGVTIHRYRISSDRAMCIAVHEMQLLLPWQCLRCWALHWSVMFDGHPEFFGIGITIYSSKWHSCLTTDILETTHRLAKLMHHSSFPFSPSLLLLRCFHPAQAARAGTAARNGEEAQHIQKEQTEDGNVILRGLQIWLAIRVQHMLDPVCIRTHSGHISA